MFRILSKNKNFQTTILQPCIYLLLKKFYENSSIQPVYNYENEFIKNIKKN